MKKYKFEITEILQKQIEIEATSYDEAYQKVKSQYKNEDIILDASDYIDTEYNLISTSPMEKESRKHDSKVKER